MELSEEDGDGNDAESQVSPSLKNNSPHELKKDGTIGRHDDLNSLSAYSSKQNFILNIKTKKEKHGSPFMNP